MGEPFGHKNYKERTNPEEKTAKTNRFTWKDWPLWGFNIHPLLQTP